MRKLRPPQPVDWLTGDGKMGACIRAFDWSKSPLGPRETWSPALRATLGVMLANRFPLLLWWGPNYISIYNDAYVPILGKKHPALSECWSEIWSILKPLIDSALRPRSFPVWRAGCPSDESSSDPADQS